MSENTQNNTEHSKTIIPLQYASHEFTYNAKLYNTAKHFNTINTASFSFYAVIVLAGIILAYFNLPTKSYSHLHGRDVFLLVFGFVSVLTFLLTKIIISSVLMLQNMDTPPLLIFFNIATILIIPPLIFPALLPNIKARNYLRNKNIKVGVLGVPSEIMKILKDQAANIPDEQQ